PLRARRGRTSARVTSQLGSVVIVVIDLAEQPTGLRVDRDLAGLAVEEPGHADIAAIAGDLDIRPAVGAQFGLDLREADRSVASNEDRALRRLRRPGDHQPGTPDREQTGDQTHDTSIHDSLLRGLRW